MAAPDALPPPGGDSKAIAEFVDRLVRESDQDPVRTEWATDGDRGQNLYVGNHYTAPGNDDEVRLVINRIQNAIVSLVAIQAGDPPRITFTPRESGEPPVCYLNTKLPAAQAWVAQLQTLGLDPYGPLPDEYAEEIKEYVEASRAYEQAAAAAGLPVPPGLYPKNLLIEVTDASASEALQTVFDGMWEACEGQAVFQENIFLKNVYGVAPLLVEFDDVEKLPVLSNVHPLQWFPTPGKSDIGGNRSPYVVYDELMGLDEARRRFPQVPEEEWALASKRGHPQFPGSRQYDPAATYWQNWEREMVVIRHAWVRHWPYPKPPEQAIADRSIEEKVVGYEMPDPAAPPSPDAAIPAEPADPMAPAPAAEEPREIMGFFLPGTQTQILPTMPGEGGVEQDNPQWPRRHGIRQITVIAHTVIDDRECEMPDVQVVPNVNIPLPWGPYGQGETKRLDDLQMAINRLMSNAVTWSAYNAHPPEVAPQAVVDRLGKALKECRTKPGQRLAIPPDLVTMVQGDLKKLLVTLETGALPPDFWKLLDLLLQLIDKEANQAEVTQGNAADSWSGETVKALQNAASQVIRGKSMYTEGWLRRITRQIVHCITTRLDPADLSRYLGEYPPQVIQAFADRVKSLYVDIAVEIASGSGASRQSETQNLVAARQMGLPISDPTMLERLGADPEGELQKQMEWNRKLGAQQAPAGAGPVAGAGAGAGQGQQQGAGQPRRQEQAVA